MRKPKQRFLIFRFSLFSLVFSILMLDSCGGIKEDPSKIKPYQGPMMKAFNTKTIYSDSAKVKIIVKAPIRLEYQNGNQNFPKGVEINFFNEKGENYTRLTSDKAKYNKEKNQYTAYTNVVVRNMEKQEKLNTEELHWNQQEKIVFTEKAVVITTPKEILKGTGLNASQDFTEYQIKHPTGEFKVPKK